MSICGVYNSLDNELGHYCDFELDNRNLFKDVAVRKCLLYKISKLRQLTVNKSLFELISDFEVQTRFHF